MISEPVADESCQHAFRSRDEPTQMSELAQTAEVWRAREIWHAHRECLD